VGGTKAARNQTARESEVEGKSKTPSAKEGRGESERHQPPRSISKEEQRFREAARKKKLQAQYEARGKGDIKFGRVPQRGV